MTGRQAQACFRRRVARQDTSSVLSASTMTPQSNEQENVLAELMQHYVLVALARVDFFQQAAFHGGTFLHIVHGLDRFSEDLDFVLHEPDPKFAWRKVIDSVAMYT